MKADYRRKLEQDFRSSNSRAALKKMQLITSYKKRLQIQELNVDFVNEFCDF